MRWGTGLNRSVRGKLRYCAICYLPSLTHLLFTFTDQSVIYLFWPICSFIFTDLSVIYLHWPICSFTFTDLSVHLPSLTYLFIHRPVWAFTDQSVSLQTYQVFLQTYLCVHRHIWAFTDLFVPSLTNLFLYKPISSFIDLFVPLQIYLFLYRPVWAFTDQSVPLQTYHFFNKPTCDFTDLSEPSQACLGLYWSICSFTDLLLLQQTFVPLQIFPCPCWPICSFRDLSVPLMTCLCLHWPICLVLYEAFDVMRDEIHICSEHGVGQLQAGHSVHVATVCCYLLLHGAWVTDTAITANRLSVIWMMIVGEWWLCCQHVTITIVMKIAYFVWFWLAKHCTPVNTPVAKELGIIILWYFSSKAVCCEKNCDNNKW